MKLSDNISHLIAHINGTLSPEESEWIEDQADTDPDLALLLEGLRQLKAETGQDISIADYLKKKKNDLRNKLF